MLRPKCITFAVTPDIYAWLVKQRLAGHSASWVIRQLNVNEMAKEDAHGNDTHSDSTPRASRALAEP